MSTRGTIRRSGSRHNGEVEAYPHCDRFRRGDRRTRRTTDHKIRKRRQSLLYTDGLTESFDIDGEFYGEERLLESIKSNPCSSASDLLDVVEKSLLNFVQDMPPADDLTMLVLRRV